MKQLLLLILLVTCTTTLSAQESQPVQLSVIDVSLDTLENQNLQKTYYVTVMLPGEKEQLRLFDIRLHEEAPETVALNFSSPVEPCGDETFDFYVFEKGDKTSAPMQGVEHHFSFFEDVKYRSWFKLRITGSKKAAKHMDGLLDDLVFVEKKTINEEEEVLNMFPVNIVYSHAESCGETGLFNLLEYGTFYHYTRPNDDTEPVLQYEFMPNPKNLMSGQLFITESVLNDDEIMVHTPQDTLSYNLTEQGVLLIKQGDEVRKVKVHKLPEGDFMPNLKGQLPDPTFPQMWMEIDGKVFLSEVMTSC